jgi:hypothetical protein
MMLRLLEIEREGVSKELNGGITRIGCRETLPHTLLPSRRRRTNTLRKCELCIWDSDVDLISSTVTRIACSIVRYGGPLEAANAIRSENTREQTEPKGPKRRFN